MTNQSEPLAALRKAIDRLSVANDPIQWGKADAECQSELAAVEERIGKLVRLVKAHDAVIASAYEQDDERWWKESSELREAREAITESDL